MSDETSPPPTESAEAPAAPQDETAMLQRRLTEAEQQRDEYLALAQQTRAEFENYQKRAAREREAERPYWTRGLAADLLPVIDNLERAIAAARKSGDEGPLAQGVAATLTILLDALKRHGVSRIDAAGLPFDPTEHEAVMQQPAGEGQEAGTVVNVLEHGYRIHERVLRPARVVVAVAAEPSTSDE
jgi:molecular chaperone GrpE